MLVRDGDHTVMTMANDFQGEPKKFAIVVPVPTVLEKDQVHIGDKAWVDHLDAYSAPRLVEYFDPDPCPAPALAFGGVRTLQSISVSSEHRVQSFRGGRGEEVKIEARFTVGEYDILILSAKQSGGLEDWLIRNGYRIPAGASQVLGSYIKQNMKFFVAKVNLTEQMKLGFDYLRPIQVAYDSPRFMLPIRLGMVNADGPQELFVYTLTQNGRVEATNYRSVKLPSDVDVPEYVKPEFGDFYRAMFAEQVKREDMRVVFTEYAWEVGFCDPCAAPPLAADELRSLGVFWVDGTPGGYAAMSKTFITRLHARYDGAHFPEDLVFQETADRTRFQGRYVMHHPWKGKTDCPQGKDYVRSLPERRRKEAWNLVALTGWSLDRVRERMAVNADWVAPGEPATSSH